MKSVLNLISLCKLTRSLTISWTVLQARQRREHSRSGSIASKVVGGVLNNRNEKTGNSSRRSYPAHCEYVLLDLHTLIQRTRSTPPTIARPTSPKLCLTNAKLTNLLPVLAAPMPVPPLPQEPCTTFALSVASRSASTKASPLGARNVVTGFFTNNGQSGTFDL